MKPQLITYVNYLMLSVFSSPFRPPMPRHSTGGSGGRTTHRYQVVLSLEVDVKGGTSLQLGGLLSAESIQSNRAA
jgi:hypothetical protein